MLQSNMSHLWLHILHVKKASCLKKAIDNIVWAVTFLHSVVINNVTSCEQKMITAEGKQEWLIDLTFCNSIWPFLQQFTVLSKSSGTKWKYFLTISKSLFILNDLCKQFGSRSGPTKRGSLIQIVWNQASIFAENWLFCMIIVMTWILRI